jgi:hypothetical protein
MLDKPLFISTTAKIDMFYAKMCISFSARKKIIFVIKENFYL